MIEVHGEEMLLIESYKPPKTRVSILSVIQRYILFLDGEITSRIRPVA